MNPQFKKNTNNFFTVHTPRFCTNVQSQDNLEEFAGLQLSDKKVQRFLNVINKEYEELNRSEIRNREGHRRLATIRPLIEIESKRKQVLNNAYQLSKEMNNEKDKDLLSLIEDEKMVNIFYF